jgi:hypothetical protein
MSQEHLLKLAYEAVLNKQQQKSSYRTLSESYKAVYEAEEPKIPFSINELKLDLQEWTPLQKNLYVLTAGKKKVETPVNVTDELNPDVPVIGAEETVETDAEGNVATGLGPGEYAVASAISGYTTSADCAKLVSGQSKSYDVSWPSAIKADYKFEVKLEGDVRIGAQGAELGNKVKEAIKNVLSQILEEYSVLKGPEKDTTNREILKRVRLRELKQHEPELYAKRGKGYEKGQEKAASIAKRQAYEQDVAKRAGWTVDGYCNAILANLGELPLRLINGEEYEYRNTSAKTETDLARNKFLITPLLSFLQAIDSYHGEINTDIEGKEEADNEGVQAVRNVLHKYYGTQDQEKAPVISKAIDTEAHKVDRKLTLKKIQTTGEGGATFSEFFKAIKKLHLTKDIEDIGEYMNSKEALRSCFPKDITGLFVVNPSGYKYVPEDKIGESIKLVSISQGKPKIELKQPGE